MELQLSSGFCAFVMKDSKRPPVTAIIPCPHGPIAILSGWSFSPHVSDVFPLCVLCPGAVSCGSDASFDVEAPSLDLASQAKALYLHYAYSHVDTGEPSRAEPTSI